MIAIFDNEKDAVAYSNTIHEYLKKNRPHYNAARWSYINKAEKKDRWAVKLPLEQANAMWGKLMPDDELKKSIDLIEKYPETWRTIDATFLNKAKSFFHNLLNRIKTRLSYDNLL